MAYSILLAPPAERQDKALAEPDIHGQERFKAGTDK
jgi:hypothetical protein